jgi:23S rRNA-/tRNA-specific pseudouridylate synthase
MMVADAQTSGGLLISLPLETANEYLQTFNSKSNYEAVVIGEFTDSKDNLIYIK